MEQPVNVLYFVDRMRRGGIQSLVMDWAARFDPEKVRVDFLLMDDGTTYEEEESLRLLGCGVFKLEGIWLNTPMDFLRQERALERFFKAHPYYKVVHLHSTSKNYMVLKVARKYGVPVRIAHSHALDFQTDSRWKRAVGGLLRGKLKRYATDYFACSHAAGRWLFGQKICANRRFRVIHNAIVYERFRFCAENRDSIRRRLGIAEDEILVGHVGRFTTVKNHSFLLEVFRELCAESASYRLLLIGTGELEESVRRQAREMGIAERIIFLGICEDTAPFFSAMDLFVMPSLYEGLGLALVEAQAAGLPCFATRGTIPREVRINPNLYFIPLEKEKWVNAVLQEEGGRIDGSDNFRRTRYRMEDVTEELEGFYTRAGESGCGNNSR